MARAYPRSSDRRSASYGDSPAAARSGCAARGPSTPRPIRRRGRRCRLAAGPVPPARAARPPAGRARTAGTSFRSTVRASASLWSSSPRRSSAAERLAELVEAGTFHLAHRCLVFREYPRTAATLTREAARQMLEGLMQHDHPLTVQHIVDRMRRLYWDSEVVTLADDGVRRASYGEVTEPRRPPVRRAEVARDRRGRPRGDVRVELAGAPRGLPRGAVDGRGAAHAEHPSRRRPARPTSRTTPRTGSCSWTRRSCRCSRRSRRRSRRSSTSS